MKVNVSLTDKQINFWNSVINPDNITEGKLDINKFDLEENIAFYWTPIQEYAYNRMGDLKGKKVLEIGCGLGLNAVIMARKGADVTAIDIAPKRVQWVNDLTHMYNLSNVHAITMPAEELNFQSRSFDIIYSNEALIHTNRQMVLARCADILREGGKMVFVESLRLNPFVNLYRCTIGPKIFKYIADHLTLKEVNSYQGYFKSVEHKEFYLFSFLAFFWQFGIRNKKIFKFSLNAIDLVDKVIFKLMPSTRPLAWMICIECRK